MYYYEWSSRGLPDSSGKRRALLEGNFMWRPLIMQMELFPPEGVSHTSGAVAGATHATSETEEKPKASDNEGPRSGLPF